MQRMTVHFIAIFLLGSCLAEQAYAYIGPGPGLSMMGSLFGLIAGIVIALVMLGAYPLRLLLKRRKAKQTENTEKKEP